MSTAKQGNEDLEAVRTIIDAVVGFPPEDQQRIFRWVAEKLKLPQAMPSSTAHIPLPGTTPPPATPPPATTHQTPASQAPGAPVNIKTFILEKKPRNDVQFAATVAYYYRFEAPQSERKEEINQEDLQEATRKAGRDRFTRNLFFRHRFREMVSLLGQIARPKERLRPKSQRLRKKSRAIRCRPCLACLIESPPGQIC